MKINEAEVVKEIPEVKKAKDTKEGYSHKIAEWKKSFGKIYKTVIDGDDFIWKRINRSDYTRIMTEVVDDDSDIRYYKRQEEITKSIILYPENIDELIEQNAGLATTLSSEALDKSGFEVVSKTEEL